MGTNMIKAMKAVSLLGTAAAAGWFIERQDFAAVLLGIVSLSILMMSFLPVNTDSQA